MKGLILIMAACLFLIGGIHAQQLQIIDGKYCTEEGIAYSGPYQTFYPNGTQKALFQIEEGWVQKMATFYSEQGRLIMTGSFKDNEKSGIWLTYDPKGHVSSRAEYHLGQKVGEWEIRGPYSETEYRLYYANDELLSAYAVE